MIPFARVVFCHNTRRYFATLNGDPASMLHELSIGRAAEHLVCADLILQGFDAYLAGAQLPYDVVVDANGKLHRVQVKGTTSMYLGNERRKRRSYRFGLRKGRGAIRRLDSTSVDVFAFVALDIRRIAYVPVSSFIEQHGRIPILVEFVPGVDELSGSGWGRRTFDACSGFSIVSPIGDGKKNCFHCRERLPATSEFFVSNARCKYGLSGECKNCARARGAANARTRRAAKKTNLPAGK